MTARFWAMFTLLFFLAAPAFAQQDKTGIALIVNDEPITVADINNRVDLYTSGGAAQPPAEVKAQMAQQIAGKLVDEKLQMQEARKLGIAVSDDQVRDAFATVAEKNSATADEFKARMMARGVNPATLMDQLRAEIAWGQVIRRKLRPQINITEAEINTEFDKIAAAMLATAPAPVETPAATDTAVGENGPVPVAADAAPAVPAPQLDKTNEALREEVATRLGMDRLNKLAERYLRDLRATAFIDRR